MSPQPPGALRLEALNFDPPEFPPERLREIAREQFGVTGELSLLDGERDQNALITGADGQAWVLKVASRGTSREALDFQVGALRHLERVAPELGVPRVRAGRDGADLQQVPADGAGHLARMLSYLPGQRYQDGPAPSLAGLAGIGRFQARLARGLRGYFHPAAGQFMAWDLRSGLLFQPEMRALLPAALAPRLAPLLSRWQQDSLPRLHALRAQVIHYDCHGANLLRARDGAEAVTGIIDFGDMIHGPLVLELVTSAVDFIGEAADPVAAAQALCRGFHSVTPLEAEECDLLYDLIAARWTLILELFEFRRRNMARPPDFVTREQPVFIACLQRLLALDRDDFGDALRSACGLPARRVTGAASEEELKRRRERAMGPAYRLFYREPVHLVRGEGVWLFDAEGRRYLDCYNNVASVGHCHPRVVAALASQAATLNTHTRYLHENVVRYAERLAATMPGDLSVCMFVCTGTEANDLAFRIARTVSGKLGAIVSEDSYHGNSVTITELSTAEYPAERRPAWLEAVEAPNLFRGSVRYGEADPGGKYAARLDGAIARLAERGHGPAMFMACGIFDANGVLTAPPGYFEGVYRRVRAAGGLCVADEVQSGLGRLGDHLWGFEDSGVIPDIVTLGKPIGDGHPLAAVVTTPAIAAAFSREFHYFNTFGGNPVSAAVGLAVLDVIEQEGIVANVHAVGEYLGTRLRELARRHPLIGDVRGKGLFYGLELVRDRTLSKPAREEAERIADRLRARGVLVGTSGPLGNVVKIRPPLVFAREHAELLLDQLESAFKEL